MKTPCRKSQLNPALGLGLHRASAGSDRICPLRLRDFLIAKGPSRRAGVAQISPGLPLAWFVDFMRGCLPAYELPF